VLCTSAVQLGIDVEQPWLMSKHDVIHKNRKCVTYHYAARGGPRHVQQFLWKIGRVDRRYDRGQKKHTERDRQDKNAHHNTALPYRGRSKYDMFSDVLLCAALAAAVSAHPMDFHTATHTVSQLNLLYSN